MADESENMGEAADLAARVDVAERKINEALATMRHAEADLADRMRQIASEPRYGRSKMSSRELVDAEKPLFDFVRYILQAVAVGVAALTVGAYLLTKQMSWVEGFFSWCSVLLCIVVFGVMVLRVMFLGMELVDRVLPERRWLGSTSHLRVGLMTLAVMSLLFFIFQLFSATLLQVVKSLAK